MASPDRFAEPLRIVTGPDSQTGNYGTPRHSTVSSWDTTLDWMPWDSTTFSFDLPYLIQRAPAGTIGGRSPIHHRPHLGAGKDISTYGIGDLSLGVDQDLVQQSDKVPIDVGVSALVETPTASVSKGLGSGKANFTGQADLAHSFGKLYAEIQGGYSIVGSPGQVSVNGVSETVRYRDVWLASGSASYEAVPHWFVGSLFEAERSSERGFPPSVDISGNLTHIFAHSCSLKFTFLRGLTRSAPNWGGGLLLGVPL